MTPSEHPKAKSCCELHVWNLQPIVKAFLHPLRLDPSILPWLTKGYRNDLPKAFQNFGKSSHMVPKYLAFLSLALKNM